jgi:hypothetical protein
MTGSHRTKLALAVSTSFLLTIVSGCHTTYIQSAPSRPVDHGPVVVRKYTYVHYPSCNVYCDRERNLWFWWDDGEWKMGVALPVRYHVSEVEAVTVEFERDTPYEHIHAAPPPIVEHGPPPHAPAYGFHRKYTYVHYPTYNVYCDRERRLWFWYENGAWKSGAVLPTHFHVSEREAVKVELEAETPVEHGNAHMVHDNGQGWEKNHGTVVHTAPSAGDEHQPVGHGKGQDSHEFRGNDNDSAPPSNQDKSKNNSPSDNKGNSPSHDTGSNGGNSKDSNGDNSKDTNNGKGNGQSNGSGSNGPQDKGSGVTPSNDPKNGDNASNSGKNDASNGNPGKGQGKDKGKGKDKDKDKPDNG